MVHIKIIRHSERFDFTHPFRWMFYFGHYWSDSPLTVNGHQIAYQKGKILKEQEFFPKYIYTSPYNRTMATATEIKKSFPHSEIIIEPLLSEYQPVYQHRIELYPDGIPTKYNEEATEFSFPETYENFLKRVEFIIFRLVEKNDDIIIVTHGEILKGFINYLQKKFPDLLLDEPNVPYLTVISVDYDKDKKEINKDTIQID